MDYARRVPKVRVAARAIAGMDAIIAGIIMTTPSRLSCTPCA
jgi:hypothetical protein